MDAGRLSAFISPGFPAIVARRAKGAKLRRDNSKTGAQRPRRWGSPSRRRSPPPAQADKIKHPTAVFSGLDKITGRIICFEVAIDETVQFGSLQVTPRVCFSRPPTEAPLTDGFAQVDEFEPDKPIKRIFSGWMFADSPGLHGVEHPGLRYLARDCKGDGELIHEAPVVADTSDTPEPAPEATPPPATDAQPVKRKPKPRPTVAEAPPRSISQAPGPRPAGRGGFVEAPTGIFGGFFGQRRFAPVETEPLPPNNVGQ